jgi:HAD superfamily hydrolase (TIGR01490 family)
MREGAISMRHESAGETIAYFDVDHTLTRVSTLESFIRYFATGVSGAAVASRLQALVDVAGTTSDLDKIHQSYAQAFRGESWSHLREAGVQWYASVAHSIYRTSVTNELRQHLAKNRRVAFVSGSWAPCLEPIAKALQVNTILQSRPLLEADGDTLSGSFELVLVGPRKATAIRAHAAALHADLADAYAYADHVSDEQFLRAVGHPVVVGDDKSLRQIAEADGWRTVPGGALSR